MRFYQDDCQKVLNVKWFFVERTDFIQNNVFVSSVWDDIHPTDGEPVGELGDGHSFRLGDVIPAGAGIQPQPHGTADQWAGQITLKDQLRAGTLCTPVVTRCNWASKSVYSPPCASLLTGLAWNDQYAPDVTINSVSLPMSLGPLYYQGQQVLGALQGGNYWYALIPQTITDESCPTAGGPIGPVYFLWQSGTALQTNPNCPLGAWVLSVIGGDGTVSYPFTFFNGFLWQEPGSIGNVNETYDQATNTWDFTVTTCLVGASGGTTVDTEITFSQEQPP